MTALHSNIRRLRESAGVTASEAAKRAGIHQGDWSDLERGKNPNPTTATLEKIAAALGVSLAELFVDEKGESVTVGTTIDKNKTFPCPIKGCGGTVVYAVSHVGSAGPVMTWADVTYRCDSCETFFHEVDSSLIVSETGEG